MMHEGHVEDDPGVPDLEFNDMFMIKDLEELARFLKLCRKQGVTEIRCCGVHVGFGDLPAKKQGAEPEDASDTDIPTEELTPEQLMFFSAGGVPP